MRETVLQKAIVDYLAAVSPATLVWAVPNAAPRTFTGRASNAVPGLRKGVFDLSMILPDNRFACIEVKTDAGKLSQQQEDFRLALVMRHVPHCVARSVDDVRAFLAEQGIKTREAA